MALLTGHIEWTHAFLYGEYDKRLAMCTRVNDSYIIAYALEMYTIENCEGQTAEMYDMFCVNA